MLNFTVLYCTVLHHVVHVCVVLGGDIWPHPSAPLWQGSFQLPDEEICRTIRIH